MKRLRINDQNASLHFYRAPALKILRTTPRSVHHFATQHKTDSAPLLCPTVWCCNKTSRILPPTPTPTSWSTTIMAGSISNELTSDNATTTDPRTMVLHNRQFRRRAREQISARTCQEPLSLAIVSASKELWSARSFQRK